MGTSVSLVRLQPLDGPALDLNVDIRRRTDHRSFGHALSIPIQSFSRQQTIEEFELLDVGSERLLALQKQPTGLPANLGATIRELDRLQIFRQTHAFEFHLEKEITF